MSFRASSVVRMTSGRESSPRVREPARMLSPNKESSPRVREPARMLSPNPRYLTNRAMPKSPKTIEGTPLRLLVIRRMKRTTHPLEAYSVDAAHDAYREGHHGASEHQQQGSHYRGENTAGGHSVLRGLGQEVPAQDSGALVDDEAEDGEEHQDNKIAQHPEYGEGCGLRAPLAEVVAGGIYWGIHGSLRVFGLVAVGDVLHAEVDEKCDEEEDTPNRKRDW